MIVSGFTSSILRLKIYVLTQRYLTVFQCHMIWAWMVGMSHGQKLFGLRCKPSGRDANKFGGPCKWRLMNATHKPLPCDVQLYVPAFGSSQVSNIYLNTIVTNWIKRWTLIEVHFMRNLLLTDFSFSSIRRYFDCLQVKSFFFLFSLSRKGTLQRDVWSFTCRIALMSFKICLATTGIHQLEFLCLEWAN